MDKKTLYKVTKQTEAILKDSGEIGPLATGQDPRQMSDVELKLQLKQVGIEDVEDVFETMELEVSV